MSDSIPAIPTDLGKAVHGRDGGYPTRALWDAVRTHRSTPGIAAATWAGGGGRLLGIYPWPGGLGAWSGWLVQAPARPRVQLSHCPGVPPHPASPTHATEDWGPKLNFLGLEQASFNHPHFLPFLNPTPPPPTPSRTSPAPGLARLPFLKLLNQKKKKK